jgi:F0F1-type ATP synthase epsilon subunit
MNVQITSAAGNILENPDFTKITLMTESGEITVLPGHEPLLSAIRPGIMSVEYTKDGQTLHGEYASGGGVLNISPESVTIVEYIESQKKEAEALMKNYREENGEKIDPKRLIELEYELLKYTAMHRLGQKYQYENTTGTRR